MYKKLTFICILLALSTLTTSCIEITQQGNYYSPDLSNDKNNNDPNNSSINSDYSSYDNDTFKLELIKKIYDNAVNGKVINCDFKVENTTIDSVINSYGSANKSEFVESAKGQYYTFASKSLVFGCNKGSQVFEIRSFDKVLQALNLTDIEDYFGRPEYNIVTSFNETLIGYSISPELKIEFILPHNNDNNPILHHYCVLWPKGTVNSMANDPGRQW